ncbi:MAG: cation:proton antiporter [Burkholderiaceae bacterium]|jgi:Kef-type K+ transport system membrane component KefB|nr:cation:proton antiporter [Burkholderiaceae bacterium]
MRPEAFFPTRLPDLNVICAFGVLLVVGVLGGLLAKRVAWLPTITGFMAVGLLIGPQGLGLLQAQDLVTASPLVDVALGLILFRLGAALHPMALIRNRALVISGLLESMLTFAAIGALLLWLGSPPVVTVLAAAIAVSSSPAVLIHVSHELHARGTMLSAAMSMVALNNVLSFVLYTLALPFALQEQFSDWRIIVGLPLYQMLGAMLAGVVVAWIIARIGVLTQADDRHYRFALVVGGVMLCVGLAEAFKVSLLFASLTLGLASRGMQKRARLARLELGGGADLFFIILFVFAGAQLHLGDVWLYAGTAAAFVGARVAAKLVAVYGCGRAFGFTHRQALGGGLMLVPMAGLAIGLVQQTTRLAPQAGEMVSVVVLAAVAVFETLGPPLVAFALRFVGEAPAPTSAAAQNASAQVADADSVFSQPSD